MRRPAGTAEIFTTVLTKHTPLHFGLCLRLGAEVGEAALRAALDETRRQHLLMSVRMVQDGAGRYFVDTEGVAPFPVTVHPASERPWTALLDEEIRAPFRMDVGPSSRFALRPTATGTELYATFHHAFADGHAAVRCLDLLLAVLGGAGRATPADRDHPLCESLRPEVAEALSRRPPPALTPPPQLDPAELRRRLAAPYRAPAAFTIRSWALSREETSRLAEASRAAGVTVHAALGAAWLLASAQVLGGDGRWRRTIQSPVDLRRHLRDEARDAYGIYFGIVTAEVDCAPGRPFVEIARDVKAGIEAQRSDLKDVEEPWGYRDAFRDVADPDAVVVSFPPWPPNYDFSLSNLGRLPLAARYGSLPVEAVWGPTFSAIHGERVIAVNTHDGVLRMTDIWDPAERDSAACDRIRALAREQLAAFLVGG
jgi:hypothetical protein